MPQEYQLQPKTETILHLSPPDCTETAQFRGTLQEFLEFAQKLGINSILHGLHIQRETRHLTETLTFSALELDQGMDASVKLDASLFQES